MPTCSRALVYSALALACLALTGGAGNAQEGGEPTPSRCLAVAQSRPAAIPVAYLRVQEGLARPSRAEEVTIRFVGHSTFLITSPEGVTIATDYNGYAGREVIPRVITMNRAHTTHYTDSPDPRIEHVLRGWDPQGGPAQHNLQVGDVLIRNVTTDIRSWGGTVPDGNSIFIFEVARLCIGHLGHLHHVLAAEDLAWIGQLDVVMVPVDGSYTMDQDAMLETLRVVRARLVLPMHYFSESTLSRFLSGLGEEFEVERSAGPEVAVSAASLPRTPKLLVLPGF